MFVPLEKLNPEEIGQDAIESHVVLRQELTLKRGAGGRERQAPRQRRFCDRLNIKFAPDEHSQGREREEDSRLVVVELLVKRNAQELGPQ